MVSSNQQTRPASRRGAGAADFLALGAWLGLFAGLIEGLAQFILQSAGGLSWEARLESNSVRILWAAPLVYAIAFALLSQVIWVASRLLPQLAWERIAVFCFAAAGFWAALHVSGRLSQYGIAPLAIGLSVATVRWLTRDGAIDLAWIRRTLPFAVALAVLVGIGVEASTSLRERRAVEQLPAAPPGAPNIVLVVLDTLRADHLSIYGYSRDTSPVIDRLAGESVLFEQAYSTSSWTLPAHASMLTGRYPLEHGAQIRHYDNRFPTLGAALQERGYRTAAITANTLLFSRLQGFGPGFHRFDDSFYSPREIAFRTQLGRQLHKRLLAGLVIKDLPTRRHADNVTGVALDWIGRDRSHPFFLFLNYFDTHDPFLPPREWRGKFSNLAEPGGRFNSFIGDDAVPEEPQHLQQEIDAYDGAISYVDHWVGELLKGLETRGLRDNTVVVITSDHGELLGAHGLMGHGTSLHYELVRVPLVIRWPGTIPGGLRVRVPVSLTSLASTLLEAAGGSGEIAFPHPSLSALWRSEAAPAQWPEPLGELAQMPFGKHTEVPNYHGSLTSLATHEWLYIEHSKFGPSLFDLSHGGASEVALNESSTHAQLVADLRERLRAALAAQAGQSDGGHARLQPLR